jgi:hypothetical protein
MERTIIDIDKLAYAVSMAETHNCTKGYGLSVNNCFGIKNGSIAPCENQLKDRTCIYEKPEESYIAFKKIWTKGYGGRFPTIEDANAWVGKSGRYKWLENVSYYYYN